MCSTLGIHLWIESQLLEGFKPSGFRLDHLVQNKAVYLAESQSKTGLIILQHLPLQGDLTQGLLHCHKLPTKIWVLPFKFLQAPLTETQNDSHTLFLCLTHEDYFL